MNQIMSVRQLSKIHYLPILLLFVLVVSSHSMLKGEDGLDGAFFEPLVLELADDCEMRKAFLRKQLKQRPTHRPSFQPGVFSSSSKKPHLTQTNFSQFKQVYFVSMAQEKHSSTPAMLAHSSCACHHARNKGIMGNNTLT